MACKRSRVGRCVCLRHHQRLDGLGAPAMGRRTAYSKACKRIRLIPPRYVIAAYIGFGDVTVLGQYRFLNNQVSGTQAAVLFGAKAPTGATNPVDPFGEFFEAEFQPGSGSWDALFGAAFSQRLSPALSFHANVLAIATGTGRKTPTSATGFSTMALWPIGCSERRRASRIRMTRAMPLRMPAMIIRGWSPRPRRRRLRTGILLSTLYSRSTASGTTSGEPLGIVIRIQAATRYSFRRGCA